MIFRIASLAIGYLFGIFQTAYVCGRIKGIDIREHGSGNAGTTNTLRVLGFKTAVIVFLGDFLKCIAAVLVTKFIFKNMAPDILPLLGIYAGAGAVLGHNFPVQLGFRGGKGIACTGGLIVATDPRIALVAIASFLLIVALTRYVSLASIVLVLEFFTLVLVHGSRGVYGMTQGARMEMYAVAAFLMLMAIYQHRANIVRLVHGRENKLSFSKKKEI